MTRSSAGLLVYRGQPAAVEVFLVHPGGPFWAKKDLGAWSIPKGEFTRDEDGLAAARREFQEETGCSMEGDFMPLSPVRQRGGKMVWAWAVAGDIDATAIRSDTFTMEWPPKSGRQREFAEVDRAAWFDADTARQKLLTGQLPLLEQLIAQLGALSAQRSE